jgi:myo-inositol-1(or 4)-monophosphatase
MHVTLAEAESLLAVARAAAAVLMEGYRNPGAVELKGPIDLVTRWDRASEDCLRAALAVAFPGVALVAEESAAGDAPAGLALWADPLDGTTNFVHGHPFFAVSIGLADGAELLAGAVVAPALGLSWHAARGHGARRDGIPCRVSETDALGRALLATGFPYDNATNPLDNFAEFAALTRRSRGVRRCGAAALDLCLTADGTFDGYWERFLKPWDLAAGALMVAEAGGRVSDLEGAPADFRDGWLVATNGRVHDALVAALRAAGDAGPRLR